MFYVLGPCSAENEQQVMDTAQAVASLSVHATDTLIFRAGLWKPRTSPSSFQGVGSQGLTWLQRVQNELHLPAATEVATPDQVQQTVQAGIAYLWIGARTAANPIAVQALADALTATQAKQIVKGVFIKNPVNEDTNLWLGNIERLEATTISIMAIHRGCDHRPCWNMAYTLRQQRPDIPLLLDPSHMSGDASQVLPLCQKVPELDLDGVMVEIHPQPNQALSDSAQQLPLSSLPSLLSPCIVNRQPSSCIVHCQPSTDPLPPFPFEGEVGGGLLWLRAMMDETDDALWSVIRQRMALSRRIGDWKKEHHIAVVQPERFRAMLTKRQQWAAEQGIDAAAVEQIMNALHSESIRLQK